ncbi:hypothetical protein GYMLUDRAFT_96861 [Collybiopsis luxurians FD-317 M1]|uniref:Uncharacterized protein n=1 Tax=Collybiopsis luxurians FD-317 M1 TaxID=944289 RepID=A0A0D0BZ59_9AGAR|nr:hypothetical protein GYMLUDRAFT_96861 [Collybiopsis luxurians FD-317 M1]
MGKPVDRYNPVILDAIRQALSKCDCSLYPPWFSVPESFDPKMAKDLNERLRKLEQGYAEPILHKIMISRIERGKRMAYT